jgi:hypothetical protein
MNGELPDDFQAEYSVASHAGDIPFGYSAGLLLGCEALEVVDELEGDEFT